jgi:hypothetical protein
MPASGVASVAEFEIALVARHPEHFGAALFLPLRFSA